MRDLQSGLELNLPPDLFQSSNAVLALRACNALADVAKLVVLRIGLFLAASIVEDEPTQRRRSIDALRDSADHLDQFSKFLVTPNAEGTVHPAVSNILEKVKGDNQAAHSILRDFAAFTRRKADKADTGPGLTNEDLRELTALAHGPFPKWEEAFRSGIAAGEQQARTELEREVDAYRKRSNASQLRIADIARVIGLVALNARVEAGRAGEAGRAFSVIAEEIKRLSEQTTEASKGIRSDLEQIEKLLSEGG